MPDNYIARCEDCRYYLRGRGKIGTEAFGLRHAIRQKHLVTVTGPEGETHYDKRATIEQEDDEPPF